MLADSTELAIVNYLLSLVADRIFIKFSYYIQVVISVLHSCHWLDSQLSSLDSTR